MSGFYGGTRVLVAGLVDEVKTENNPRGGAEYSVRLTEQYDGPMGSKLSRSVWLRLDSNLTANQIGFVRGLRGQLAMFTCEASAMSRKDDGRPYLSLWGGQYSSLTEQLHTPAFDDDAAFLDEAGAN